MKFILYMHELNRTIFETGSSKLAADTENKTQAEATAQTETEAQGKWEEAIKVSGWYTPSEETKRLKLTAQHLSLKSVTFNIVSHHQSAEITVLCGQKNFAGCWLLGKAPPLFFPPSFGSETKNQSSDSLLSVSIFKNRSFFIIYFDFCKLMNFTKTTSFSHFYWLEYHL